MKLWDWCPRTNWRRSSRSTFNLIPSHFLSNRSRPFDQSFDFAIGDAAFEHPEAAVGMHIGDAFLA